MVTSDAHAAALAGLGEMGSRRLARLLDSGPPSQAWARVIRAAVPSDVAPRDLVRRWRREAAATDLAAVQARLGELDLVVSTPHDPRHPRALVTDVDPAPVIFRRGRALPEGRPAVAIVGTRRCSPTGREVAVELGMGLAAAGVVVVSGLALGIDAAAHRGALQVAGQSPVAVVGSGLDVVYPRRNADLWHRIAAAGTLLSESHLGCAPEGWRFPARNRLLAALVRLVVVVESKAAGGSMHTVEQAIRREVPVMAVPGSVRNPAAEGTNLLLSEGCAPVRDVDDVLVALDLATAGSSAPHPADRSAPAARPRDRLQRRVLAAIDDQPVGLDTVLVRLGGDPAPVAAAVDALVVSGLLVLDAGHLVRPARYHQL